MLQDIVKLSKKILDDALNADKEFKNPKNIYKLYDALLILIDNTKLVSDHYLALDFADIESSSMTPEDKWRWVINKDLEKLNISAKKYLQSLNAISYADSYGFETILTQKYNTMHYYGFIRDEYSVGHVQACSFILYMTQLNVKINSIESAYMGKHKKIDLTTLESRKLLQEHLTIQKEKLQNTAEKLREYIVKKYITEDLL